MNIEVGQKLEFKTRSFGTVRVEHPKASALHFYFKNANTGRDENGFMILDGGEVVTVHNVPQRLIQELPL